MYSIHNEGKSIVAERFTNYIVNEYSNTNIRTIKMRPVDVKENPYIDITKEVNDKDSKFKVGDHLRISKYKNIFAKGYTPNWFEEIFIAKEVQNTVSWAYVINDLNREEIFGIYFEKELQKASQKKLW